MPIPIFLLDFVQEHKRYPRADEMTLPQRQLLKECIEKNRRSRAWSAEEIADWEACLDLPSPDPESQVDRE